MAEVSEVDGVALASIGKVNGVAAASISAINGVTFTGGGFAYNGVIAQSAMFNSASSSYTKYDVGSTTNRKTFSMSAWVKRSKLAVDQFIFGNGNATGGLQFNQDDKIEFRVWTTAASDVLITTPVYRDCSGWYHIVVGVDTTDGTAANRVKLYVNGTQVTDFDSETYPIQNYEGLFNTTGHDIIVGAAATTTGYFDGYIAEAAFIDGTQYAASDFGETKNGIWVPKDISGLTYGTHGSLLDFADNTDFGNDVSGENNDFTDNAMGTDHQVLDTPESNHCIIDVNSTHANLTLSDGGQGFAWATASWRAGMGTFLLETGKWYWEVDIGSDTATVATGISPGALQSGSVHGGALYPGDHASSYGIATGAGVYNSWNNASSTGDDNLDAPAANDVMTVAVDADAGKIWFGLYNAGSGHVWGDFGATGVGNPAAGTNPAYSSINFALQDYVPVVAANAHSTGKVNFGQRTFSGTKPSGFNALSEANKTAPVVVDPQDDYINTVIYEGTGAELAITGVGFTPDLVWIKNRDAADSHHLYDSTRGATNWIEPDLTVAQQTDAQGLKSFDADGFTLGTNVEVNTSAESYVAWCLKKQSGFFDIQTYEGTGVAHTESHSLGVIPEMMIIKNIDAVDNWMVYHKAGGNTTDPETDYAIFSSANAWADLNTVWNDTAPTSSVFTVGTHVATNTSSETYMAYLFASVPGVSKVSYYTGSDLTTARGGAYVYCGFRPRWIILKSIGLASDSWRIYDISRDTYNRNRLSYTVVVDLPDAEGSASTAALDIYGNGFKLTKNSNAWLYQDIAVLAFSDQPGNYANAR
jgi:hypothetical protein